MLRAPVFWLGTAVCFAFSLQTIAAPDRGDHTKTHLEGPTFLVLQHETENSPKSLGPRGEFLGEETRTSFPEEYSRQLDASPLWCKKTGILCPSFLLIGERKCGTTSLFHYILQHPSVLPPKHKEPGYLDKPRALENLEEYASNFPPRVGTSDACMEMLEFAEDGSVQKSAPICTQRKAHRHYVTGEATATLLTQADPAVVFAVIPTVRLVAVLRCPVQRALSHHRMHARFKAEGRKSFMELAPLTKCLTEELDRVKRGERPPWKAGPYLGPGIYWHHLRRWAPSNAVAVAAYPGGAKMADGASVRRPRLVVVFTEELEVASKDFATLMAFLGLVFDHIGAHGAITPGRAREAIGVASPPLLNVAPPPVARSSGKSGVSVAGLNSVEGDSGLLGEFTLKLCSELLGHANARLEEYLGRPVPEQWACKRKVRGYPFT
mmetsp:Transcript_15424/g.31702  ORF Transcript_15424/g.31702 Transcript_15424/m.31702 type:complete len:436 (+) Transcript_15424:238-1545(+)